MLKLFSQLMIALVGTMLFLATGSFPTSEQALTIAHRTSVAQPAPTGQGLLRLERGNPDIEQMIAEIKKEKAALTEREQKLGQLEDRLLTGRAEINQVTQTVHQLQIQFDASVVRVREEETANLKKLAKIHAAMSPEGAALILKEMTDDQIVKILVFMKDDDAAPILETMAKLGKDDSRRVAGISERIRLAAFRPIVEKNKNQ
jgi:flagellar motility protein MotE (MotC chaperone)